MSYVSDDIRHMTLITYANMGVYGTSAMQPLALKQSSTCLKNEREKREKILPGHLGINFFGQTILEFAKEPYYKDSKLKSGILDFWTPLVVTHIILLGVDSFISFKCTMQALRPYLCYF